MRTEGPAELLGALAALRTRQRELDELLAEAIAQARGAGLSWSEIGRALGVSKQAAWQLYNARVTQILDGVAVRAALDEEQAMRLAREELAAVRRQRRTRAAS